MESTLLLNASYEPLRIIPWQKAITLCFLGKVEVVEEYDKEVRSVSLVLKVPAVVRLTRYIHLRRRKPPLTRVNLLARDDFQCQYCRKALSMSTMTVEHIVPRSQGGETSWLNVVSSCGRCNRKKGGRTPKQAGMKLISQPFEPEWLPVLTVTFNSHLPDPWLLFLDPQSKER